jgi:tRNA-2-methylthio-N6-dimethylallyladenosine synthase
VPYEEKSKWFQELLAVQEEIAAKRCASMVGNVEKVLIEDVGKNGEVNGRTSGNIIVEVTAPESTIGTFQNVKITKARNWILKGELA